MHRAMLKTNSSVGAILVALVSFSAGGAEPAQPHVEKSAVDSTAAISEPGMAFASDLEEPTSEEPPAILAIEEDKIQPIRTSETSAAETTATESGTAEKKEETKPVETNASAAVAKAPALRRVVSDQVPIEAAAFNGLRPAESTVADVKAAMGEPYEYRDRGEVSHFFYNYAPFEHVEITVADHKVASILIKLNHPESKEALTAQLGLTDVRPAAVLGDRCETLGYCYPERGVLFGTDGQSQQISHILLEPIDAMPFMLRAEADAAIAPTCSLADLERALELNPRASRAHWLEAQLLLKAGCPKQAVEAAQAALDGDPKKPEYILTHAAALTATGEYAAATKAVNHVLELSAPAPEVVASAHRLRGELLSSGIAPDFTQSYEAYVAAIQAARPLLEDASAAVRQQALETLVDSHLGIVRAISWGRWKQKGKAVPRWIAKAQSHAEELAKLSPTARERELQIYAAAVAAAAAVEGTTGEALDASEWISSLSSIGERLLSESTDPMQTGRLHWELGVGLIAAAEVSFAQQHFDAALKLGRGAIEHLGKGRVHREDLKQDEQLVAQAAFRVGAVHSVHLADHKTAIKWFDQAYGPLASSKQTAVYLAEQHRGEAFVGMAVSYWEAGDRRRAVELTEVGAKIIATEVKSNAVPDSALAVSYRNLASMYQVLGNPAKADRYSHLAQQTQQSSVQQATFQH